MFNSLKKVYASDQWEEPSVLKILDDDRLPTPRIPTHSTRKSVALIWIVCACNRSVDSVARQKERKLLRLWQAHLRRCIVCVCVSVVYGCCARRVLLA